MKNLIIFDKFIKKFKSNTIGPISFQIGKGRISGLLGTSGGGKTVLLNSLLGIIKKYKVKITVDNIKRKSPKYHKSNRVIGYYTQMDFALHYISAYNFLKDSCMIMGVKKNKVNEKVKYWMKYFDVWEHRKKKVKDFSWGMKNRMNLILCFIKDPEIIIMDKPGANLDSYWRNKVKNLLIEFKNQGKTIIITVHNIDEISDIIDDYAILESGKKIFEGSTDELSIYPKYEIFIKDFFDVEAFRKYLLQENIKSFKYDEIENSLVITAQTYRQINYLFLYLIKNNLPLVNLVKLPINMESIHKALENRDIKN
ncbi:ATP-binding cassette domain-containing protein [Spiroplasma endosymbiont of Cantharis nigra]|uniref:ATP-binding cassette domain-containing protein n=1 Tax=Spiroplasma endosymbiont of Cantharis nigra TaxID=3066278 RepID=UPI0030D36E4A